MLQPGAEAPGFFCGCLAGTMDLGLLIKALCLVLVIEGIPLFLAPNRAREAALQVARMPGRTREPV